MSLTQVVATDTNGNEYNTVPTNLSTLVNRTGGAATKVSNTYQLDGVTTAYSNLGVFGSTVIDGDDADKALSAGVFAYNNESPIAKRVTDTLSTVSNDVLLSGAAQPSLVRSIHELEVLRTRRLTTAIRQNKWNEFTGEFDAGYPVVTVDTLATDNAANPTRAIPGLLNYKSSGPTIVSDNYSKKTGW